MDHRVRRRATGRRCSRCGRSGRPGRLRWRGRPAAGRGYRAAVGRGRGPDAGGRAGEGGARARPAGRRRRTPGPALPARAGWRGGTRRAGRSPWTGWSAPRPSCCVRRSGRDGRVPGAGRDRWRAGARGPPRTELARRLLSSEKDRARARARGRVARRRAAPAVRELDVPDTPAVIALHNVSHLASDVHGKLDRDDPAIAAAPGRDGAPHGRGRRHPAGAPRCALIAELEGMDRGRYAGPGGLDGRRRQRRARGWRCAAPSSTARWRGCSPAAGWWRTRTPTPRSARRRRSCVRGARRPRRRQRNRAPVALLDRTSCGTQGARNAISCRHESPRRTGGASQRR